MCKDYFTFFSIFLFIIVSCSTESLETEDIQNFTSKFKDQVWIEENSNSNYSFYRQFDEKKITSIENYNGNISCDIFNYGELINGEKYDLVENSQNKLILKVTEDIDGQITEYLMTVSIIENEKLKIEFSNEPSGTEFYLKYNENINC